MDPEESLQRTQREECGQDNRMNRDQEGNSHRKVEKDGKGECLTPGIPASSAEKE